MADPNDPMPWESNPTLIPVVANLVAALLFLGLAVLAVVGDHSPWFVLACAVMLVIIASHTWRQYKRWRDRNHRTLTR